MKQFEVIFDYFNQKCFNNQLPTQQFCLDISKKYIMRWSDNQITIGLEFVSLNEYEIILSILHEMIHLSNYLNRIEDVGINQYHKKQFLQVALDLGFYVIKHKCQGWSIISPVPPRNIMNQMSVKTPLANLNLQLKTMLKDIKYDKNDFKQTVDSIAQIIVNAPASKTFFLKYKCNCPEPHNSIRSGRRPIDAQKSHPSAVCRLCGQSFVCVSEIPD